MIVKCGFPCDSAIDRRLLAAAYYQDSYRAPVRHAESGVVENFLGIFAHTPVWIKVLLVIRNKIASWCGLDTATTAEIMNPEIKKSYAVGDKIGPWPIFALTESELIAGRDNKHLDFRLSILRIADEGNGFAIVSTVCKVRNTFGKIYLFCIVPFHKWGIRRLITNAVVAGRL